MLYHRRLAPSGRTFENAEQVAAAVAADDGWVDSPAKFPTFADVSPEELYQDFLDADEQLQQGIRSGASPPGSPAFESLNDIRTLAEDRYRHAKSRPAKSLTRQSGKSPKTFHTAFRSYRVVSQLRAGQHAIVYKSQDGDGNLWAIKRLQPNLEQERLKRFKNEIAFCAKSHHRNVIKVEDWGLVEIDQPFFVMKLFPATLQGLMKSGIAPSSVLSWFAQMLAGVEAAHKLDVYHRDLKPENLLCDPASGRLVVSDFGIAHFAESMLLTSVETRMGGRLANFAYAAPEQRQPAKVDQRADIYALGLILNEMFTGQVIQGTGYKKIAEVAPEFGRLDQLVELMVRQSPSGRPTSIEEIRQNLSSLGLPLPEQPIVAGDGGVASTATPVAAIRRKLSGDELFRELELQILQFADQNCPKPAHISPNELALKLDLKAEYVRQRMVRLHRDGFIEMKKWFGESERSVNQWPNGDDFFFSGPDNNHIRVYLTDAGKQRLENLRSQRQ